MLKKLRREFVLITMALTGLVLVIALGSTLVATYTTQMDITRQLLERSLENGYASSSPRMGDPGFGMGDSDSMAVITADVSEAGVLLTMNESGIDIDSELLEDVLEKAAISTKNHGWDPIYHLSWMRKETTGGFRVAICDTQTRDTALVKQAILDAGIIAVSMVVLFFVVQILAGRSLKPVQKAWDQQRRFISDASHELKTPLAVILANTQILQKDSNVPEDARRWINSTSDEATHMKGLVEDLLTLARADEAQAGNVAASATMVDVCLTDIVDDMVLEFDAVAYERGCSIEAQLAQDIHVNGDKAQLGRVVKTLLDNATKYAPVGGVVKVELTRDAKSNKKAHLQVTNGGDVIAPEDLEHLFDRFYRTDEARTRQERGGFGLGLAIAKSIVDAHGGKIWATSTQSVGTTFHVLL